MEAVEPESIKLSISDPAQLAALQQWLSWQPGLKVSRVPGEPDKGQLGFADVIAVVAGSSSLTAAVRVLPDFLRSRRSRLSVTVRLKDTDICVAVDNTDEVMAVINRLLDD